MKKAQSNTITLSGDKDLFFHTAAASQISDALGHAEGERVRFQNRLNDAIHAGEIDAYCHRDGALLSLPLGPTKALCIRPKNVNDWLADKGYEFKWSAGTKNGTTKRWGDKQRSELEKFRATHTMAETSKHFSISEQRIRQILPKELPKESPQASPFNWRRPPRSDR